MGLSGISANLMSLGGIAIAIGMLGDGSIVMVENIYRHLTAGDTPNSRSATACGKSIFRNHPRMFVKRLIS